MSDPGEILDSSDLAEEGEEGGSNLVATRDETGGNMEFHVSMRGYTLREMEDLIVAAGARQLLGKFGDSRMVKLIEERAIALISAKADERLERVSEDIIDQPLTPSFGAKQPVTMREYLGLYAREYLAEKVDREGKPSKGGWGEVAVSRMEFLLHRLIDRKFKAEMEKAITAAIVEVQREVRKRLDDAAKAELARLREALTKSIG